MLQRLLHNIRFYVLVGSILLSALLFLWVQAAIPEGVLQTIRLAQIYGLLALLLLYTALLAGPFTKVFPAFRFKAQYIHARRAVGVSTFYFALLHGWLSFFNQLGGFDGIKFYTLRFVVAVVCSAIALLILFLMTLTSLDVAVKKMGFKNWKLLHRLVYGAGILILIHVALVGTHFGDGASFLAILLVVALGFLFAMEILATQRKVEVTGTGQGTLRVIILLSVIVMGLMIYYVLIKGTHEHATAPFRDVLS